LLGDENQLLSAAMNRMKLFTILVFVALVGCSNSPASETDLAGRESGPIADTSPAIADRLALEAGLKKIVYHIGPVNLPRWLESGEMLERPLVMTFQSDEPVWMVGFSPRVVDLKGSALPSDLLHMAILSNLHEENPLCSDAGGGLPFAMATSMLTDINLPQGYGYPILSTDPMEARVSLKNESSTEYQDVFFELTLLVKPMNEQSNLKDVKPMLLELDPCGHSAASIAPNDFAELSASFEASEDVAVVAAHGALSNFGSSIEVGVADDGVPFWRADAKLDSENKLLDLEGNPFVEPQGISVSEGSSMVLSVTYNNTSDKWLRGAPAAAMIYATPKE